MKPNDIRNLNPDEQLNKIKSLKEELFNLRFQHATGQLENPLRIRELKRSIAQIHTIIRERQLNIRQ